MRKVLFLADLHLSATPPGSRTDDYTEASFAKLDQVSDLIKTLKIDALVILGDVFHLKSWTKNPYALTNRFIAWLKKVDSYDCEICVVVGNHDVPFGNVGFVANQPIGTVLSQPFVKRSLSFDDPSLKIVTHDFDPAFVKSDLDQYKRDGAKFLVVCAHQNFLEHGQLPKEPTVNFDEIHADIDVLAFGHIHTPTVLTKVNNIWFVNPGAMMRGTLHKDNLQREVNVIVMRFDEDIKFKKFALNIVPSDQIFDLEKKERKDAHDDRISAFVEMLGSTSASSLSSDPTTVLDAIDTDERVKELARMYLDGGSIDVDAV